MGRDHSNIKHFPSQKEKLSNCTKLKIFLFDWYLFFIDFLIFAQLSSIIKHKIFRINVRVFAIIDIENWSTQIQ